MERVTADEAVLAYYRAAVERAGGKVAHLLRAIEPEAPDIVRRTATNWTREGQGRVIPGYVLVAIHRTWPDLSIDLAVGPADRPRSLEERLSEVERIAHQLMADYGELRREVGLPMARFRAEEEPGTGQDPDPAQVVPSQDS